MLANQHFLLYTNDKGANFVVAATADVHAFKLVPVDELLKASIATRSTQDQIEKLKDNLLENPRSYSLDCSVSPLFHNNALVVTDHPVDIITRLTPCELAPVFKTARL